MIAEQATVFALGPSAGSHLNTAVASIALGTNDIGRPVCTENLNVSVVVMKSAQDGA
jgi:hypothetical protein